MNKARLLIVICLAALFLPGENVRAVPEESADDLFLAGARAFAQGDDKAAADLVMAAARLDERCLWVLWQDRFTKWLPPQKCSEVPGLKPFDPKGDAGPCALYRLGWIRRNAARLNKPDDLATRKAGHYYLLRAVDEFAGGPWAGEAALLLIEDGGCLTDAGYPDCRMMTIRAYEDWMSDFPRSWDRPKVVRILAREYIALADQLDVDAPWGSKIKAELCRGRALELARGLDSGKAAMDDVLWSRQFIKEIRESGQPWSIMPEGAVSESKRMKQQDDSGLDYRFLESGIKAE